jgi:mono/diheme cytochrome c family protein
MILRICVVLTAVACGPAWAAEPAKDPTAAIEALVGSIEKLRGDPAALQKALDGLKQQAADARKTIDAAKAGAAKSMADRDEKTKQLAAMQASLADLAKKVESAQAQLAALEKDIPLLTEQVAAADQKLAAATDKSAALALSLKAVTALGKPVAASPPSDTASASAVAIINAHCIECHSADKAKGGLVLTSREMLLKGAKSGPVVTVGKSAESLLMKVLPAGTDPHMPPKEQLTDPQIAALRTWIDGGLVWNEVDVAALAKTPVQFQPLPASFHPALSLAVSVDQKRLAVGRGNMIQLYNLEAEGRPLLGELAGHEDVVQSLAFSPDGKWLASGGYRRVVLWDVATMKKARELAGFVERITALTFSPDNASLFIADGVPSQIGIVRLFSVEKGEPIRQWDAHTDTIFDLEVTADGNRLASGGGDKTAKVWNLADFTEYAKFEGHTGRVLSVAFKPDGTLLATGSEDRDVKVWNLDTKDQKITIGGHGGPVNGLIWTADGKHIVSAGQDGTVRFLTEDKTGPAKNLTGAADVLYAVAADPEGKTVYSACHDGWVYVWGPDNKAQAPIGPAAAPVEGEKAVAK